MLSGTADMTNSLHFFEIEDLLYRLSKGLEKRDQAVVFLVGAGLSAPVTPCAPGVCGTDQMIALIKKEFEGDADQLAALDRSMEAAGEKRYQAAFLLVQGRLGQATINDIVRRAVLQSRLNQASEPGKTDVQSLSEEYLRLIDFDSNWHLNPGTEALGKLAGHYPDVFGRVILTTNFDPLIEVAIRKAGGDYFKTALHADGNLSQTEAPGCHVAHLHGYWHGSDTLHTVSQLQHPRPHLKASLTSLLRNKIIFVSGYGGWDDVFTDALLDVVCDDAANAEILWTFFAEKPRLTEHLANRLSTGIARGRVSLYAAIDCNSFFPQLYAAWAAAKTPKTTHATKPTNQVVVSQTLRVKLETNRELTLKIRGDDEDRPPLVELCVGRDAELQRIRESKPRVVFITGIGGQGKSTLAAQYFKDAQKDRSYSLSIWRDCKEESERFENQLASVVETLSAGRVSGEDLSKQDIKTIVQVFMSLTRNTPVLLIFDNADHYVNLEAGRMTSSADVLIGEMLATETASRVVLTCRPSINYRHANALSFHLEGISMDATHQLFAARGAVCDSIEIENAHAATNGHAFWLDLLSLQVAKQPSLRLRDLLENLRTVGGFLPEETLTSIWGTLTDRAKLVLRLMAEAVRPETDSEIADHLRSEMNYKNALKAINTLKSLNLVVVKRRPAADDFLELHPLVRQFIRKRFSQPERSTFIVEIIKAYRRFISTHRYQLGEDPTLTTLQYWSNTAELDVAAGRIADAILTLVDAGDAFVSSGYTREFCRASRLVLGSFPWISDHGKYKGFDPFFRTFVNSLCDLGEWGEVNALLDKFNLSVLERDARYILYCDLKCHAKWSQGDFVEAIQWGKAGQSLKQSSDVDTSFDASHNLALAERDAGHPELALPYFLDGRALEEILDPEELDEDRGGPHYGNIGRCLHLMGQVDSALICYQKSALLIEKNFQHQRILNQGYVRRWVGELLLARGETRLADVFLRAAKLKWEQVSPPKATQVSQLLLQLGTRLQDTSNSSDADTERACLDWISGRLSDA